MTAFVLYNSLCFDMCQFISVILHFPVPMQLICDRFSKQAIWRFHDLKNRGICDMTIWPRVNSKHLVHLKNTLLHTFK